MVYQGLGLSNFYNGVFLLLFIPAPFSSTFFKLITTFAFFIVGVLCLRIEIHFFKRHKPSNPWMKPFSEKFPPLKVQGKQYIQYRHPLPGMSKTFDEPYQWWLPPGYPFPS